MQLPDELFQDNAERRVRLGLAVAELVKANNLTATPEQLKAYVDELAASYERPEEVVRWYYADQNRMADAEAAVLENNVTEFVMGQAKVTDKKLAFDELMQQPGVAAP